MNEAPWQRTLAHISHVLTFKGALASVALSHPADCTCEVCKAAAGDEDAFARLLAEPSSGTKEER